MDLKFHLDPVFNTVTMNYAVGSGEYGRDALKVRRNRLVKTNKVLRWKGYVHEYLEVFGPVCHSDVTVTHLGKPGHSIRNLQIYEKLLGKGEPFSARDYFYYANELRRHKQYEKAIQYYTVFMDLDDGWMDGWRIKSQLVGGWLTAITDVEIMKKNWKLSINHFHSIFQEQISAVGLDLDI